jgi:hypothetical protein
MKREGLLNATKYVLQSGCIGLDLCGLADEEGTTADLSTMRIC